MRIGTWCGKSHATSKAIFGHFTVVAAIYDSIVAVELMLLLLLHVLLLLFLLMLLLLLLRLKLPLSASALCCGSVCCCPNLILIIGLISYITRRLLLLGNAIELVVVLVELFRSGAVHVRPPIADADGLVEDGAIGAEEGVLVARVEAPMPHLEMEVIIQTIYDNLRGNITWQRVSVSA